MSLRKAINDKCRDCIYDSAAAGNWRQQVTLCSCRRCPLWPYRPRSSSPLPASVLTYSDARDSSKEEPNWPRNREQEGIAQ